MRGCSDGGRRKMRVFMLRGRQRGNVVVFYNLTANGGFSNRLPRVTWSGDGTAPMRHPCRRGAKIAFRAIFS